MEALKRLIRIARRRGAVAVVVCLAYAALAGAAYGQDSRGTVTGTVTDTSKGVIPGATVTVTNAEMGTTASAVTNEAGSFQIPYPVSYTHLTLPTIYSV